MLCSAKFDESFVGSEDEVVDLSFYAERFSLRVFTAKKRLEILLSLQQITVTEISQIFHNKGSIFECSLVVKIEPFFATQMQAIITIIGEDVDDPHIVLADVLGLCCDLEDLSDVLSLEPLFLFRELVKDVLENIHH